MPRGCHDIGVLVTSHLLQNSEKVGAIEASPAIKSVHGYVVR